jgi:hypothetical protein
MATQTLPQSQIEDLPNGPVAAALLAGGIGSAAMGIITTASEASTNFANSLKWVGPVGPLSGKTILTVIIFAVSWVVLHFVFRGKETNFSRMATIAFVLLAIGLLGTFPPFFDLFVPKG